jgi:hypothetical protein
MISDISLTTNSFYCNRCGTKIHNNEFSKYFCSRKCSLYEPDVYSLVHCQEEKDLLDEVWASYNCKFENCNYCEGVNIKICHNCDIKYNYKLYLNGDENLCYICNILNNL